MGPLLSLHCFRPFTDCTFPTARSIKKVVTKEMGDNYANHRLLQALKGSGFTKDKGSYKVAAAPAKKAPAKKAPAKKAAPKVRVHTSARFDRISVWFFILFFNELTLQKTSIPFAFILTEKGCDQEGSCQEGCRQEVPSQGTLPYFRTLSRSKVFWS